MRTKIAILILTALAGANSRAGDDRFHLFRPCEEIMKAAGSANFALKSAEFKVPARKNDEDMVTFPANPDAFLPGSKNRGRLSADAKVLYVSDLGQILPRNLDDNVRLFLNSSASTGPAEETSSRPGWLRDLLPKNWTLKLGMHDYLLVSQYPNAMDRLNVEMMVYDKSQGRPSRPFYRTSAFNFEVLEKYVVVSINVFNSQNGPYPVRINKAYWIMDEQWPKFLHYAEHKAGNIYFPIENFSEFIATIRELGWEFY